MIPIYGSIGPLLREDLPIGKFIKSSLIELATFRLAPI